MNRLALPTSFSRYLMWCLALLLAACGGGGGKVGLPTGTALFTNAPSTVTVAAGAKADFTIGGGTPTYSAATSNKDVATASVNGTALSVSGVGAGSATITVTDAAGASTNVAVTVSAPPVSQPGGLFTTAAGALTVPVAGSASYTIGGGKAPYAISSSNVAVASATVSGSSFTVTGLSSGAAQIVITDAAGTALDLAVTVGSGTATPLYTTAPSAVSVNVGATASYAIGGGKPGYTVSSSNNAVVQVAKNGNDFLITGVAAGSAQVAIVDSTGAALSVGVTVGSGGAAADLFSTAPGNVVVGVGATASYLIGGGKPAYAVASSNAAVATVATNGSAFIISGVSAGTAQVLVSDAQGASLAIGVTVGSAGVPATPVTFFTTAPTAATVAPGATASYAVDGGTAPYAVSSSNAAVASVSISGKNYVITGVSAGTAVISAFDAAGAAVSSTITVGAGGSSTALYSTAPAAVTIAAADTATFTAGGGSAPYSVSTANAGVAKIALTGNTFTITAIAPGATQVHVFDASGTSLTIAVTVPAPPGTALFTTAPGAVIVGIGASPSYSVGGGTGSYSVSSSNAAVASASLAGSTVTINAVSAGSATVVVSDSAGTAVPISVTVTQATPVSIVVSPGAATGNVGDTLTFQVSGGTPGYTIVINNTSVATVAPASVGSGGGSFVVTLRNVGSTSATITDAAGQVTSLPITANQTSTILRLSPSALVIGENVAGPIALNIFGGTGPYRAFTSDETKSTVSVSGSVVTVNGVGTNNTRCITPITADGTYVPFGTYDVTITTIDNLGASATSVITIQDNGQGAGVGCL